MALLKHSHEHYIPDIISKYTASTPPPPDSSILLFFLFLQTAKF
jgi:hypothetical protein